jgi:hypothetical protein
VAPGQAVRLALVPMGILGRLEEWIAQVVRDERVR